MNPSQLQKMTNYRTTIGHMFTIQQTVDTRKLNGGCIG
jgi:hypothetical protein